MNANRFIFTAWRFGLTFPRIGIWVGLPRYVTRGHGFKTWWRPFGRWSSVPGRGTYPSQFAALSHREAGTDA